MGAEFNYYIYKGSKEDLSEYHAEHQVEACYEGGTDTYAGHIGIMPDGIDYAAVKSFDCPTEARDYLEDNHRKWSRAMAVPFQGQRQDYDRASKAIIAQQKKAAKALEDLQKQFLKQIKATKSKTIGCKECGSSVSRKHLHSVNCPVCGERESFYNNTQRQRLNQLQNRLKGVKNKPLKRIDTEGVNYIIGGWCAA